MTDHTEQITEIWRYPVKSVGGERLERAEVGEAGEAGISGDRQWGIVNVASDTMLTARREPRLLFASAAVVDAEVVMTLPDGTETNDDASLSEWLGYDVQLVANADVGGGQTYEIAEDFEAEDTSPWLQWQGPSWSFHDSRRTAVSVAATASFRDWDPRRFRINVIVDRSTETDLYGASLAMGSAEFDVTKGIDRCVIVTRPQPATAAGPELARDLDVLRTINRDLDRVLGAGCLVTKSGELSVGDAVIVGG